MTYTRYCEDMERFDQPIISEEEFNKSYIVDNRYQETKIIMPNIKTTTKIKATLENHTKLAVKKERKKQTAEEKAAKARIYDTAWRSEQKAKGITRWGTMTQEQKDAHQERSKQSRLRRLGKV